MIHKIQRKPNTNEEFNSSRSANIKPNIPKLTKLTKENYKKLKQLTGSGFVSDS